jgi:hypothetical protein
VFSPKTLLIGAIGTGCLVASGVGGYFAVKSNLGSVADAPISAAPATGRPETKPDSTPVATIATAPVANVTNLPAARQTVVEVRTPVAPEHSRPGTPTRIATAPAASAAPTEAAPQVDRTEATPLQTEAVSNTIPEPIPPAAPITRSLTIPTNSVIGIRIERGVSSETARLEDKVAARVTRDVRVDDAVVIPAGAKLEGTVTLVERGGRFKERARIGIQFTTLVIDDARVRIQTEKIVREGEAPTKDSSAKIGASAVVGTILGAVIGGGKGAAIGGAAGAGAGSAAVMAGGRNEVAIAEGAALTVRLAEPIELTVAGDN